MPVFVRLRGFIANLPPGFEACSRTFSAFSLALACTRMRNGQTSPDTSCRLRENVSLRTPSTFFDPLRMTNCQAWRINHEFRQRYVWLSTMSARQNLFKTESTALLFSYKH